jgi:hypothetical protein
LIKEFFMERKLNDPLRELLEFVRDQIENYPSQTQDRESITELKEQLEVAIQDLKENPGPSPVITD